MVKIILGLLVGICILYGADSEQHFSVGTVSIKIYDNKNNKIVYKPTNIYGNGMNLFLAINILQEREDTQTYRLTVEGFGKGRENGAEGLVEDYSVYRSKDVTFYGKGSRYVPFILQYPCTHKSIFNITLTDDKGCKVSKKIRNNLTGCYLN